MLACVMAVQLQVVLEVMDYVDSFMSGFKPGIEIEMGGCTPIDSSGPVRSF